MKPQNDDMKKRWMNEEGHLGWNSSDLQRKVKGLKRQYTNYGHGRNRDVYEHRKKYQEVLWMVLM